MYPMQLADALRGVLPTVRLRPAGIGNGPLRMVRPMNDPVPQELHALLDNVGSEMIGWGTAVGLSRALRQAERLVPGITIPWTAYATFAALSEASRGNITRALQTLPLTSVLPAQAMQLLAECLHQVLPRDLFIHDPTPLVIGVAACALVHALQRSGQVRPMRTSAGAAVVGLVRALRTATNLLAGVDTLRTAVREAVPDPAAHRAGRCTVPAFDSPNATHWSAASWPRCRSAGAAPGAAICDAWPLPGAIARKARVRAKPPGAGAPKVGGRSAGSGHAARGQPGQGRRAPARQGGADGVDGPDQGAMPGMNKPSAFGQIAQQGKESTAVGKQGSPRGKEGLHPAMRSNDRKVPSPQHPVSPDTGSHQASCGSLCNEPNPPRDPPPAQPGVRPAPVCLRFHATGEARLQVRKMRFATAQPSFCVPRRARDHFMDVFASAKPLPVANWMKTHVIREATLVGDDPQRISKYFGLGQIERSEPREPTPLDDDELYSVLSVSPLSQDQLLRHRVPASRILAPNSFRLLDHEGVDGVRRTFIAFFVSPLVVAGVCRGVRVGFLEVTPAAAGGFEVQDQQAGYGLTSTSLSALVTGVQQMSGCTFQPSRPDSTAAVVSQAPGAGHLFVREQAIWCGDQDYTPQAPNERLPFLIARSVRVSGQNRDTILYQRSFLLGPDSLVYLDAQGALGRLRLVASTTAPDRWLLVPRQVQGTRFMQAHHLLEGGQYRFTELIELLEQQGMTWIPSGMDGPCQAVPVVDDAASVQRCGLRSLVAPEEPGLATPEARRSWFSWQDGEVRYADHDGTEGSLRFLRHGVHGRNYRMAADNAALAVDFARRNQLLTHANYAEDEILWLLKGQGLVQVSADLPADQPAVATDRGEAS